METNAFLSRLDDLLRDELRAGTDLLAALRHEYAMLRAPTPPAIEEAVSRKHRALADLETLGRRRETLIRSAGFRADRQGIEACLARHDPQRRTPPARRWRELLDLMASCQQQNLTNGIVIQASQRHTRQALAILRGQPGGDGPAYGPGGEARQPPPSQPLARA